jgi:hypothetical protein
MDISVTLALKMVAGLREPGCEKIAHAHEVVAGEGQECGELDLPAAPYLRPPQKSDGLCPTEGFLDQFPRLEAQGVSGIAGRARIEVVRSPMGVPASPQGVHDTAPSGAGDVPGLELTARNPAPAMQTGSPRTARSGRRLRITVSPPAGARSSSPRASFAHSCSDQ